jgi:hypothetical protein
MNLLKADVASFPSAAITGALVSLQSRNSPFSVPRSKRVRSAAMEGSEAAALWAAGRADLYT